MERVIVYDRTDAYRFDLVPARTLDLRSTEELNGEHSLTLLTTQPVEKTDRILIKDGMGYWHEWVVCSVIDTREGELVTRECYCVWSLQYDLSATFVSDMYGCGYVPGHESVPHPVTDALAIALGGTSRWDIGYTDVAAGASASFYRMSGWDALKKVVERWGGELGADIDVSTTGVVGRHVTLRSHEGAEVPTRRFDYGRDVAGITRTVEDSVWPCRIIPLGASQETDNGGYTRRPDISGVNGGVMWLQDDDVVDLVKVPDGVGGWEYPTAIVENDTYEDPAELKAWALDHISEYTRPTVSYEIEVVQLVKAGLSPHGVALGDEVIVVDRDFAPGGLRISARVVGVETSLLDPTDTTLTIGNAKGKLSGQLSDLSRQVGELTSQVTNGAAYQRTSAYVSRLLARMNAEANATGGYTYYTEGQGLRTYDVAVSDPLVGAEASQVVEVKGGTIRIADTKDAGGDWEWRTLLVSGRIATEMIDAIAVRTGYIGGQGGTYIDLDSNVAQLGKSDGFHVVVNDEEIGFYDGEARTAYVNGEKLYIPLTVVLDAMQVGQEGSGSCWQWVLQDSGNLTLMWIG